MKSAFAAILVLGASVAQATNHVVTLGAGGQLVFTPNTLTAAVDDTISFQFLGGNHSVVSSTFAAPCMPNNVIFSGFQPVAAAAPSASAAATTSAGGGSYSGYKDKRAASTVPEFTITVNTTAPLWFYCAQAEHCQMGMVMAVNVNATSNKTFDAYKAAAASASANVAPTFAPEGGVLSEASPASSSGATGAPGGSASSSPSAASMNIHEAGFTTMFVVAMIALFGGFMAVL